MNKTRLWCCSISDKTINIKKINENILIPNLINTKEILVLLLKNLNLLNQTLIR